MDTITTNHLSISFSEWALKVNEQKHDILELMLKSDDILARVIAKDILKTAGVEI